MDSASCISTLQELARLRSKFVLHCSEVFKCLVKPMWYGGSLSSSIEVFVIAMKKYVPGNCHDTFRSSKMKPTAIYHVAFLQAPSRFQTGQ